VQSGGSIYTVSNVTADVAVEVTFANAVLTLSTSKLALSMQDTATNPALTGAARSLVVTNTGGVSAINVALSASTLPVGTAVTGNTCSGTLPPGAGCTITVTPGSQATSSCTSGTAPTPDVLNVSADNAPTVSANIVVLGYGCIHEGGYLFAVDDTTPSSASIGGKVAATVDQAAPNPNGVIWSSNGSGPWHSNVDNHEIGVSEISVSPCVGAYDGACNTSRILAHYSPATTFPRQYFAAGQCTATISGYSDWYLPALCELGECGNAQSVQSNLVQSGLVPIADLYWTSTEYSPLPAGGAYSINFFDYSQFAGAKDNQLAVRCVREIRD
jgi:hypothetical protein